jgi:dihydrofolate reductase
MLQKEHRMRRVIVQTQVSLDGVQENPHLFVFDYSNEETLNDVKGNLLQSDALLMGRVTYQGFAAVWPTRTGDEFSDMRLINCLHPSSRLDCGVQAAHNFCI